MFSVNQVFSSVDQDVRVRVCHVAIDLASLAVVDLERLESDKPICKPKVYQFDEFAAFIKKNGLTVSIEMLPAFINYSDDRLVELNKTSWINKRDKKAKIVSSLLNEETIREYLYGNGVGDKINELIVAHGVWKKTSNYYRQLNRFVTYGCVNNALLPFKYANCGSNYFIPQDRDSDSAKRGRKTKAKRLPGHVGQQVHSQSPGITQKEIKKIKKIVREAVGKVRKNITARARLMYRRDNECKFVDEATAYGTNKKLVWNDENECLSEGQFGYHFNKHLSEEDKIKSVKGQTIFDKDYAERDGSAREGLIGPTHRYEIDATIMDIHVRYPYSDDEQLSMGRAVLYVVVDVFSTCIVGIYIGFHGPDWIGAAEALTNAMMDKVSFAARYGLHIESKYWSCHHIPFEINSDNGGEYSLNNISSLLRSNLGIQEWTKTRAYMGVAKSVSERKFGVFNDSFLHYQPGAVYEVRRDEQDPSQNATWDLESLYCAVISEVIYHNNTANREEHHDFKASKQGVSFSPQAIFDFYLDEEMSGGNPTTAEDEGRIRLACLPEGEATVTDQGIRFQGIYYTSSYAKSAKWYFKAKNFGHFPIRIKWTRTSTNIIWYQTPDNKIIHLKIKPLKSGRFADQVWESVAIRQNEYAFEQQNAKREKANHELQKDHYQQQLLAENEAQLRGVPENTTKSRQKGIQERKDKQIIIEKRQFDERNKAAIGKIENHPLSVSELPPETGETKTSKSKRKQTSLNSRLQRPSRRIKK